MHKVVLTIQLEDFVADILNSGDFSNNTGLRILSSQKNILCNANERGKGFFHPNPNERIFDLELASKKGKIKIVFGQESVAVTREVEINGEDSITVKFPK